jgi:tetratricopeptide (TPR) repeat protein
MLTTFAQAINRYARAEILFEKEEFEEAIEWYASLFDGDIWWGTSMEGFGLLRTATAKERLGDTQAAIDNYGEFLRLFANAEPVFQPLVEEAERRLEAALDASVREPAQAVPATPSE